MALEGAEAVRVKKESEVAARAGLHTDTPEPGAQAGHIDHGVKVLEPGEHEQGPCGVSAGAGLHTDTQEPGAQAGHLEHKVKEEPGEHELGACGVSVGAGLHTDTREPGVQAGRIEHEVKVEPWEHEHGACGVSAGAGLHTDTREPGAQAGRIEHEVKVEPWEHEQGACGVSAGAWLHTDAGAGLHTDIQEPGAQASCIEHEVKVEPWEHEQGVCSVSAWAGLHTDVQKGAQGGHIEHEVEEEPGAHEEGAAVALAALYQDHKVKEDLMVGPEELHQPKLVLVNAASLSTAERSAVACRACSVRLEHMRVDLQRRVCTIGPHTYKLRSCLNSQRNRNTRKKTNISKNKISKEEIDVVSLGTSQLPLGTTLVRTDSLPGISAQERQHIQRTVASAMSLRPAARKRQVPPAANRRSARGPGRSARGPGRRGRRSNTDTDSEAEAPEIKRRSIHNSLERLRRSGLKNLFDELKKQIPATRGKERAPKVVILREAASLCHGLREERERLRKQENKLLTNLKKLRTIVASRYRPY